MNQYECKVCNYTCKYYSNWTNHIETFKHKNNGITKRTTVKDKFIGECSLCKYKTNQEIAFKNHMLTKHSTNEEKKNNFKFYCELCNYGTFDKVLWSTHSNTKKHKYLSEFINKT